MPHNQTVNLDVTERKATESTVQEWQTKLDLAQNRSLRIGLWKWNIVANTVCWSDEIYRQWGFTRDTFSGRVEEAVSRIHPEDRSTVEKTIQTTRAGGSDFAAEYRVVRPDGSVCWIDAQGIAVRPEAAHMLGISIDITKQKKGEESLQETQAELARAFRIATVGELMSSIAHEINQPLTAVITNGGASLRFLALTPPNLGKAREAMTMAIQEANRVADVIRMIRDLMKKAPPKKEALNVNEVIQDVLALTESELMRSNVSVRTKLAAEVPAVLGDRIQLQQVLLNLVMNAIDAMSTVMDRRRRLLVQSVKHPLKVLVRVQDSGIGLDPDQKGSVFEPFFTTKREGIGVGLSISRSIIHAHCGRLWAVRGADGGAVFQFTLPTADVAQE
jgi:PAS domain S-box-containing protein